MLQMIGDVPLSPATYARLHCPLCLELLSGNLRTDRTCSPENDDGTKARPDRGGRDFGRAGALFAFLCGPDRDGFRVGGHPRPICCGSWRGGRLRRLLDRLLHHDAAGGTHRLGGRGILLRRDVQNQRSPLLRKNLLGHKVDDTPSIGGAAQRDSAPPTGKR